MTDNTLLAHLSAGEAAYVRDHGRGGWNVTIFKRGSAEAAEVVATNMDKGMAAWFADAINEARQPK